MLIYLEEKAANLGAQGPAILPLLSARRSLRRLS